MRMPRPPLLSMTHLHPSPPLPGCAGSPCAMHDPSGPGKADSQPRPCGVGTQRRPHPREASRPGDKRPGADVASQNHGAPEPRLHLTGHLLPLSHRETVKWTRICWDKYFLNFYFQAAGFLLVNKPDAGVLGERGPPQGRPSPPHRAPAAVRSLSSPEHSLYRQQAALPFLIKVGGNFCNGPS